MMIEFNSRNGGMKSDMSDLGSTVELKVIGYKRDDKCEAVVVSGMERVDGWLPHITLSSLSGVKPVYSNQLLVTGFSLNNGPTLDGVVSIFTDEGWKTSI
jgi:hypothetical protein